MRIAYFSDNSYPELSGIVDSILITGKELKARGHEVVYVGPRYTEQNYKLSKRVQTKRDGQEYVDDMPIVRLPSVQVPFSPTGQSRFAFPIGASFKYLDTFKPDIIHTQSPYGTGYEAIRAAKRYQVPLIGTNHTPVEEFYPYAKSAMRHFDAWYYNHCDFVTAPYQGLIDNMRQVGFKKDGRGQANPVPFLGASKTDDQKRQCKIDMQVEGPMILVSGRLAPEKRVEVVITAYKEVFASYPTATLVITGHGSNEKSLQELAKKLGVEKRVRFVGFISPEKLSELYCTADVYVIMSTAETQSLSLMQAFASGIPAIAARSRGLVDYCPPDCGFQVEPGDTTALAEKIKMLLGNQDLRHQMGAAGIEFVKKFTPQKIADEWEKIYKEYKK